MRGEPLSVRKAESLTMRASYSMMVLPCMRRSNHSVAPAGEMISISSPLATAVVEGSSASSFQMPAGVLMRCARTGSRMRMSMAVSQCRV